MKTKTKKIFILTYISCLRTGCLFWRHNARSWGLVFSWERRGTMGLYGADIDFCPQIQGWRAKKREKNVFVAKFWASLWRSLVFFVQERKFSLACVFWRSQKKKGLQNFFSGEKGLQKFFSGDLYLRKPKKGLSRFSARFVAFSNEILTVQK